MPRGSDARPRLTARSEPYSYSTSTSTSSRTVSSTMARMGLDSVQDVYDRIFAFSLGFCASALVQVPAGSGVVVGHHA